MIPANDLLPRPTRAPLVHKFGGAALAEAASARLACRRVASSLGGRAVVVVSAVGEVTDLLAEAAREAAAGRPDAARVRQRHKRLLVDLGLESGRLNRALSGLETLLASLAARGACTPAELDHVLSFGERLSARLFASALRAEGLEATPLDAFELGLSSDSEHGRARPTAGTARALGAALAGVPGVPVVTGFIAADEHGRVTTLGRNGSDLTAALVAEAVGAGEVRYWKRVDGVLSADPGLLGEARTLRELDYRQAATLAQHGANVLHPDTLAPLQRAGVEARVLDLERGEASGTRIRAASSARGWLGVAVRRRLALARVASTGVAQLAALRAEDGLDSFDAHLGPGEAVLVAPDGPALACCLARLTGHVELQRGLAAVTLVAARPVDLDLAQAASALERAGVAPRTVRVDGARAAATWLVAEHQLELAARALHALVLAASAPSAVVPSPNTDLPLPTP